MKAPSYKVSLILLVTILAVVGTILLTLSYQPKEKGVDAELKLAVDLDLEESELGNDIDGDGLSDWEEVLWKTDPRNPDTDGDGTSDGEEVDLNRDPTVAGPDDEIYIIEDRIIEKLSQRRLDESGVTSRLSTDFVKNYFTLRSQGDLSEEDKERLVNGMISNTLELIDFEENRYKESQFVVFESNDNKEKLLEYAEGIYEVMVIDSIALNDALDTGNYLQMANILGNAAKKMVMIEVPEKILSSHASLTNDYVVLSQASIGLDKEEEDPFLASASLATYYKTQESFGETVEDITLFLKQNGIIYEDGKINLK